MTQWIKPEQLSIVNFLLTQDPALRRTVLEGVQILAQSLASVQETLSGKREAPQVPEAGPSPAQHVPSLTAEIEPRILDWFKAHTGKHGLAEVRADLGVEPTSKPFKTAIGNLVESGQIKFNGKRGKGAEYWHGK
jgi:hypothetical protein